MIKVAHISAANVWRGAEQQLHWLFNTDENGIENFLFCPEGSPLNERNKNKKAKIETYYKLAGIDLAGGWKLAKFIRTHQIQLLHLHDSHALNLFWIAYALGNRIPAVYHKHHNHPVKNKFKYDANPIKKIICVSSAVYQTAAKQIAGNKLVIIQPGLQKNIPVGPSADLKKEFNLPADARLIGTVCALEKEKNLFELVQIAKTFTTAGKSYFIIVGTGSYEKDLRNSIQEAGLGKKVLLAGFRNDVPQLLPQFDAFLFSSLSEGFPGVLLEAMQAKIPIVTRTSGGIPEMVTDGETGWFYHSVKEACEKLQFVLRENIDPQLEKASRSVDQYSVENMIQKTHNLYKEICG